MVTKVVWHDEEKESVVTGLTSFPCFVSLLEVLRCTSPAAAETIGLL